MSRRTLHEERMLPVAVVQAVVEARNLPSVNHGCAWKEKNQGKHYLSLCERSEKIGNTHVTLTTMMLRARLKSKKKVSV
ncbi:MAG: hypothetical protein EBY83_05990 [Verrucomicrobia bacterium]|nr:hypothetical protein [Verrucomicrobiota bacterium]